MSLLLLAPSLMTRDVICVLGTSGPAEFEILRILRHSFLTTTFPHYFRRIQYQGS
jgi:hypothetical protein